MSKTNIFPIVTKKLVYLLKAKSFTTTLLNTNKNDLTFFVSLESEKH